MQDRKALDGQGHRNDPLHPLERDRGCKGWGKMENSIFGVASNFVTP